MNARTRIGLLAAVARERLARSPLERRPEPMVMDEEEAVAAFDVADPIYQLPVYALSAEATSRLLPGGGTVLDLGSGTGRLLAHLARARPDVRVVGTDLAETMLATGRRALEAEGVADRVELRQGDMTALPGGLPPNPDVLTCVWALHHLPDEVLLRACAAEIARVRDRCGCAVWIFDFARLRREATIDALLALSPSAPARLADDGRASMHAAWTDDELRTALHEAGLTDLRGGRERVIGHFQCWWAPARDGRTSGHDAKWRGNALSSDGATILKGLRAGMTLPS